MAKAPLKIGSVTIAPDKTYDLQLARAVNFGGMWLRPSDKKIRVTGEAIAVIAQSNEGAIIDATEV